MAARVEITNFKKTSKVNFIKPKNDYKPVVSGFPKDLPNRKVVTRVTFKTPKTNGNVVRTRIRFKK